MQTRKYLWQIINELGSALTGFKTEDEAKACLPQMKTEHQWKVTSYLAEDWETN